MRMVEVFIALGWHIMARWQFPHLAVKLPLYLSIIFLPSLWSTLTPLDLVSTTYRLPIG